MNMQSRFAYGAGLVRQRYCAVCDHWYSAGTFEVHKASRLHQACLAARASMAAWYKANGS